MWSNATVRTTVGVHCRLCVVVQLQVRSVGADGVDVEGAVLDAVLEVVLVAEPGRKVTGVERGLTSADRSGIRNVRQRSALT